jgi:polyisoprenoid-binding protein YceI
MNKQLSFSLVLLVLVAFLAACGGNQGATSETGEEGQVAEAATSATTFTLDPAESQLEWVGKKVTGQHNGTVKLADGQLMVEGDQVTAGEFAIDMTTINNLDLEDPETNQKLVGHLRSDDFFAVEAHPSATFAITKVETAPADSAATHMVYGNLTIKDITHEIMFPATVSMTDGKLMANADFAIDRTKWDIRFRSGQFFEDLGDKLIYDDIEFTLGLVATPEAPAAGSADTAPAAKGSY